MALVKSTLEGINPSDKTRIQSVPFVLADADATLTTTELLYFTLSMTPTVTRSLTLPSVANMLASLPNATVTDSVEFTVRNNSNAFDINLLAGAGGSGGPLLIAPLTVQRILISLTSVAAAASAYTLSNVGGAPVIVGACNNVFCVPQNFATIQGAIDAALAAGFGGLAGGPSATVNIDCGSYTESLVLHDNINLVGQSPFFAGIQVIKGASDAPHTYNGNDQLNLFGITFVEFTSLTTIITQGGNGGGISFDSCSVLAIANSANPLIATGGDGRFTMVRGSMLAFAGAPILTIAPLGSFFFQECVLFGGQPLNLAGPLGTGPTSNVMMNCFVFSTAGLLITDIGVNSGVVISNNVLITALDVNVLELSGGQVTISNNMIANPSSGVGVFANSSAGAPFLVADNNTFATVGASPSTRVVTGTFSSNNVQRGSATAVAPAAIANTITDQVLLVTATGIQTLPSAILTLNSKYSVVNRSGGGVTVTPLGGEQIDGGGAGVGVAVANNATATFMAVRAADWTVV